MTKAVAEVVRKALDLGEEDRAEVASRVLESLEVPDAEDDAAWVAELERRGAELESGAVEGVPWEAVRERLLGDRRGD